MSETVIKIENLWKQYRLGLVGSGTLKDDLRSFWYRSLGKEDLTREIGSKNTLDKATAEKYVWVLKNLNLEVKQGEILGIIGKNGAGKSTLLKVLSRVTGPTKGSIKVKGRIASLLEVGTGMHPELTGRENIFLNGAILGMTRLEIKRKFDEIVDFAGIAKYIDTPVKRYSSGMRVKLGFAVAAFLEPEILIVDEVLAVGDAEFQKKAIGKMQDVSQGQGRTVLFVSHNMATLKNLCTRGVLLSAGEIISNGPVSDIINEYLLGDTTLDVPYQEREAYEIYSDDIKIKHIEQRDNGLRFVLESTKKFDDIALVVNLYTKDGTLVFKTSTAPIWSSKSFEVDGEKEVILEYDDLQLMQDFYTLGVQIAIPKIKVLVSISNAIQIEYMNIVNYGGNRIMVPGRDGLLKVEHQWIF